MLISTRGRYALRVMIDMAEHYNGGYIPLKEIAERQDISLKYLEAIMSTLSKAGMVDGLHGKGGGYKLAKEPENCKIGDILRLTEGSLSLVSCLEDGNVCERASECRTLPMWSKLNKMINDFFDSITIYDLMQNPSGGDYSI